MVVEVFCAGNAALDRELLRRIDVYERALSELQPLEHKLNAAARERRKNFNIKKAYKLSSQKEQRKHSREYAAAIRGSNKWVATSEEIILEISPKLRDDGGTATETEIHVHMALLRFWIKTLKALCTVAQPLTPAMFFRKHAKALKTVKKRLQANYPALSETNVHVIAKDVIYHKHKYSPMHDGPFDENQHARLRLNAQADEQRLQRETSHIKEKDPSKPHWQARMVAQAAIFEGDKGDASTESDDDGEASTESDDDGEASTKREEVIHIISDDE